MKRKGRRDPRLRRLPVLTVAALVLTGCPTFEGGDLSAAVSIVNDTDGTVTITYDRAGLPEQTILSIARESSASWQVPGPECWSRVLVARDESGDPIELGMPPICNDDTWIIDGVEGG